MSSGKSVIAQSDIENAWAIYCKATGTDPGERAPGYSTGWRKTRGRLHTQEGQDLEQAYLRFFRLHMLDLRITRLHLPGVLFQLSEGNEIAVSDVPQRHP